MQRPHLEDPKGMALRYSTCVLASTPSSTNTSGFQATNTSGHHAPTQVGSNHQHKQTLTTNIDNNLEHNNRMCNHAQNEFEQRTMGLQTPTVARHRTPPQSGVLVAKGARRGEEYRTMGLQTPTVAQQTKCASLTQ
jgi:hypothetical protein